MRWPRAADADAITSFISRPEAACWTAAIPHPYPQGEAERFILQARAGNASGAALVLAIDQKAGSPQTIGLISARPAAPTDIELGYVLAPQLCGRGFATEAVAEAVNALFRITMANSIIANSCVDNPASRQVLEKLGFSFIESGLEFLPVRRGMQLCDRFRLDRRSWAAKRVAMGESRAMPPMAQQSPGENRAPVLAMAGEQMER